MIPHDRLQVGDGHIDAFLAQAFLDFTEHVAPVGALCRIARRITGLSKVQVNVLSQLVGRRSFGISRSALYKRFRVSSMGLIGPIRDRLSFRRLCISEFTLRDVFDPIDVVLKISSVRF